jgi:hypothetical protein
MHLGIRNDNAIATLFLGFEEGHVCCLKHIIRVCSQGGHSLGHPQTQSDKWVNFRIGMADSEFPNGRPDLLGDMQPSA